MGPFSSNWDRAVELFYQIKGGCVDYGMLHANSSWWPASPGSPAPPGPTASTTSSSTLSPAGAMEENDWVKDQPDVYYFSVGTRSSYSGLLTGWSYPDLDTNPLIAAFAGPGFMDNYTCDSRPFPPVSDAGWWPSDAVVNTVSQKAPTWALNAAGQVYARPVTVRDITGGATPQPGVWNWKGLMAGYNHFDIIGWTLFWDSVGWYKAHIDQLRSL